MLQLSVANSLGYTLAELTEKMSTHEIVLWSLFFEIQSEEQERMTRRRG